MVVLVCNTREWEWEWESIILSTNFDPKQPDSLFILLILTVSFIHSFIPFSVRLTSKQTRSPSSFFFLLFCLQLVIQMFGPRVKVRQHREDDDDDEYKGGGDDHVRDLGLKAFLSLSLQSSTSPVKDHKVVSMPSTVKVPNCYVTQVPIPRVRITEDFEDCSLTFDPPGCAEPESDDDDDADENQGNIRAIVNPQVSVTEDFGDCSLTSDSSGLGGSEKVGDTDENKVANLIPRVTVTEDFGDCSLTSDSSGPGGPEIVGDTDENKVNIRSNLIPRVTVTEDFGDCNLTSDLSGPEKDGNTNGTRVNIRPSSIPRPRAVISSPDNDILIRNKNKIGNGRLSASKNTTLLQNRHVHCKVKLHDTTDITPDARKCKEIGSKEKIDSVGRKKIHKGNIKSENLPRQWKF